MLRRRRLAVWCGAVALACASYAAAAPANYRLQIVTDHTAQGQRIADDLSMRLLPLFTGFRTELAQPGRRVVLAIGPAALRKAVAQPCDCVVIAAFTASPLWQQIVGALPAAQARAMTAVYAEPAPDDQLALAQLLYQRPVHIATLLGPDSAFLRPQLGTRTEVLSAPPQASISDLLRQIGRNEVLLAVPDRQIFTSENLRNILLSTYRRKQAVIGFSSDMVKVGALASTYSEIEDINAQLAQLVAAYVRSGVLPPPAFPRYFRTAINDSVARSLDLQITPAARQFARARP